MIEQTTSQTKFQVILHLFKKIVLFPAKYLNDKEKDRHATTDKSSI